MTVRGLEAVAAEVRKPLAPPWPEIAAWTALGLLWLAFVPLFVCLGLSVDFTWYGVCARDILHGGVLERDINMFFKSPIMALVLAGLHVLFGWRSEAIRLADFAFVSGIVWLLVGWLRPLGVSRALRIWTAVVLYAFYLSTSEICHCQPDMWMLLPALGALYLRRRQVVGLIHDDMDLRGTAARALLEGLCWGVACLFKPFVVVPGLICWLLAVVLVWRATGRTGRRLALDALGLLAGGALAGAFWLAWLWWGGGWSYFWDDFRVWGGGYYSESHSFGKRTLYLFLQFRPWALAHLVALPVALLAVCRCLTGFSKAKTPESTKISSQVLLAGLYLGWVLQANYLQYQLDYHVAPTVLLALTLVAGQTWLVVRRTLVSGHHWVLVRAPVRWAMLLGLLGFAAARHPLLDGDRLRLWGQCWREGSSAETRDELSIAPQGGGGWASVAPDKWQDLKRVAGYLRAQALGDGELTCHGMHTSHLYLDLDLAPSTRFIFLINAIRTHPANEDLIRRELNASRQRLVVSDLREIKLYRTPETPLAIPPKFPPQESPGQPLALPAGFPKELAEVFPWSEPIVFRSGPFLVHRVTGPVGKLRPQASSAAVVSRAGVEN